MAATHSLRLADVAPHLIAAGDIYHTEKLSDEASKLYRHAHARLAAAHGHRHPHSLAVAVKVARTEFCQATRIALMAACAIDAEAAADAERDRAVECELLSVAVDMRREAGEQLLAPPSPDAKLALSHFERVVVLVDRIHGPSNVEHRRLAMRRVAEVAVLAGAKETVLKAYRWLWESSHEALVELGPLLHALNEFGRHAEVIKLTWDEPERRASVERRALDITVTSMEERLVAFAEMVHAMEQTRRRAEIAVSVQRVIDAVNPDGRHSVRNRIYDITLTMARVSNSLGKYATAEQAYRWCWVESCLDCDRGPDDMETIMLMMGVAYMLYHQHKHDKETLDWMHETQQRMDAAAELREHIRYVHLACMIGQSYANAGRHDEARPLLLRALELTATHEATRSSSTIGNWAGDVRIQLGYEYQRSGDLARAHECFTRAREEITRDERRNLIDRELVAVNKAMAEAASKKCAAATNKAVAAMKSKKRGVAAAKVPPPKAVCTGDDKEDPTECVMCYSAKRDTLLEPCAHIGVCAACALLVAVCPICRAAIESRRRVFLS